MPAELYCATMRNERMVHTEGPQRYRLMLTRARGRRTRGRREQQSGYSTFFLYMANFNYCDTCRADRADLVLDSAITRKRYIQ